MTEVSSLEFERGRKAYAYYLYVPREAQALYKNATHGDAMDFVHEAIRGNHFYAHEIKAGGLKIHAFAKAANASAVAAAYAKSSAPPQMLGARQGEFVVGVADGKTVNAPLIGTDYLMDCVAVVLQGYDPKHPEKRISVLGHVDATIHVPRAINEILGKIPASYHIEATMLGSPQGNNPYLNTQIMHALRVNPRVATIAHDMSAASTVMVDVRTGVVFAHARPESGKTKYQINHGEFPFAVVAEFENTLRNVDRNFVWEALMKRPTTTSPAPQTSVMMEAFNSRDRHAKEKSSFSEAVLNSIEDKKITPDESALILSRAKRVFADSGVSLSLQNNELVVFSGQQTLATHPVPKGTMLVGKPRH